MASCGRARMAGPRPWYSRYPGSGRARTAGTLPGTRGTLAGHAAGRARTALYTRTRTTVLCSVHSLGGRGPSWCVVLGTRTVVLCLRLAGCARKAGSVPGTRGTLARTVRATSRSLWCLALERSYCVSCTVWAACVLRGAQGRAVATITCGLPPTFIKERFLLMTPNSANPWENKC